MHCVKYFFLVCSLAVVRVCAISYPACRLVNLEWSAYYQVPVGRWCWIPAAELRCYVSLANLADLWRQQARITDGPVQALEIQFDEPRGMLVRALPDARPGTWVALSPAGARQAIDFQVVR